MFMLCFSLLFRGKHYYGTQHNQNSNYLALLNLADDGTYTVTKIEIIGSDKFVYIEKT